MKRNPGIRRTGRIAVESRRGGEGRFPKASGTALPKALCWGSMAVKWSKEDRLAEAQTTGRILCRRLGINQEAIWVFLKPMRSQ